MIEIIIKCNSCNIVGIVAPENNHNVSNLREQLKSKGWTVLDKEHWCDLCPQCSEYSTTGYIDPLSSKKRQEIKMMREMLQRQLDLLNKHDRKGDETYNWEFDKG